MNKVIIINLNGNAYQLEEDGFDALRAYLDSAGRRLEGNPDRDEIIGDIEQAIADKFRSLLGPAKTVVLGREVASVIAEMGPVEDASGSPGAPEAGAAPAGAAAPGTDAAPGVRRLYRVPEGAMLFGVCNGLAAYLNLDPSLIRIAFVILSLLYGAGIWIYLLMALVIPRASTSAERAAASGIPSTAQEFIRRAREGYYEGMKTFGDRQAHREWKRRFKQQMRSAGDDLRREWRQNPHRWAFAWHLRWAPRPVPGPGAWVLYPVLSLLSVVATLLFLGAAFSLLTTGAAFGIAVPVGVPTWLALVVLFFLFQMVRLPLRVMRYAAVLGGHDGYPHAPIFHFWNGMIWFAFFLVVAWYAGHHPAGVHAALAALPEQFHQAVHALKAWWEKQ